MRAGDPHPQHAGTDREAQRGVEHQRFAVDAGGDRAVGAHLEVRRGPFTPRPLKAPLSLAAFPRRTDHGDPEQAVVDPRAGA